MLNSEQPRGGHRGIAKEGAWILGACGVVLLAIGGATIDPTFCAVFLTQDEAIFFALALLLIALGGICVAFGAGLAWLDHRRSRGLERGAVDWVGVPAGALLAGGVSMFVVTVAFDALWEALNPLLCF